MKTMGHIVVGLGLEPGTDATLAEACLIAEATGATVTPVHVVNVPTMPEFGDDLEELRAYARTWCNTLAAPWRRRGIAIAPRPVVRIGDPGSELLRTLDDVGGDLLAIGITEETPLGRLFNDSVKVRMIREARQPVWLVHPERAGRPLDRILCAVDTTQPRSPSFDASIHLARLFGARLDLVRVVTETGRDVLSPKEQIRELHAYAERIDLDGMDVGFCAAGGEPGGRILNAAEETACDLLVLGPAARRGIRRWMDRHAPERIVRKLPCSLLTAETPPVHRRAGGGRLESVGAVNSDFATRRWTTRSSM